MGPAVQGEGDSFAPRSGSKIISFRNSQKDTSIPRKIDFSDLELEKGFWTLWTKRLRSRKKAKGHRFELARLL